jgi:hypothetical protein
VLMKTFERGIVAVAVAVGDGIYIPRVSALLRNSKVGLNVMRFIG